MARQTLHGKAVGTRVTGVIRHLCYTARLPDVKKSSAGSVQQMRKTETYRWPSKSTGLLSVLTAAYNSNSYEVKTAIATAGITKDEVASLLAGIDAMTGASIEKR